MIRIENALPELLSLTFLAACGKTPESQAAPAQSFVPPKSATVTASRRTALTEAVALVAPAVVTVQTEIVQRVAPDPFDWFFGGGEQSQRSAGLGT